MSSDGRFQLHMITDGMRQADELGLIVEKALRGGADTIQLRYKSAPALDLYSLGQRIKPIVDSFGANLLINDRIDVALALDADGVHLAGKSLPVDVTRHITGERFLLGCSVHSVEEARTAEQKGASYITFGHIFPTSSKPGLPPQGIEGLRKVVESVEIPVLAIGGITIQNIDQVLSTGCAGIAAIGAISHEQNPELAASLLRSRMNDSKYKPRFSFPRK
ncbi:thiamine phosphate synthase [Effusibacillus lacus]|uniref:Thiamine-phosphate synthase n=1 Tax=Effusibacillus lacus TaxID=1348429 RepID=A0A292YL50_9BACL|nr:thiamine phosphate synthase [Effusibacillus lacus]TCS71269.1 thiamine-phosphate pyrophosphorylase [Effusibacillus lacus]GAX89896.1 thiamine phosphate synthase [Effusibacillus lacus]